MQAIVGQEAGAVGDANIALHANDWSLANNDGDHPDHLATGALVRDANVGHAWNLFWYIGYPNFFQTPNVLPGTPAYITKWNLIVAYDNVMKAEMGETIIGTSHTEDWAQRTIFRSQLSPLPPPPVNPPAAPSTLQATASSTVQIDLTWTDNSTDEQGFRIERAPDVNGAAGTYAEIGTVIANVATYSNTALTGNTKYWYRVRAYNTGGNSSYSNEVSATTPVPPAAPSNLQAAAINATRIDLTWTDNSSDEQGFHVERAPDVSGAAGTFAEIATVAAGVTTYCNTGVSGNTRYWYRVRSYNAIGPSGYSNVANATTPAVPPPTAPTNLVATAASTATINLTWSDNATDEQGYRIERADDAGGVAGTYTEIATVAAGVTNFSSAGLTANTKYWHRVRAYNTAGVSSYSNEASAATFAPPPNAYSVEFYLQAHEDDWQLFFGNRVAASIQSGSKVVLIYITAGDAGVNNSNPGYWQARQAAVDASVDFLTTGSRTCSNPSVNGHAIMRCIKANTVSYYFRLPDGGGVGNGFGYGSIEQLQSGSTNNLRAVDGSASYTSWTDLVNTAQAIVTSEAAGQSDRNLALHVTDWNPTYDDGDHPDHMATGQLVRFVSVGHTFNLFWYVGYPNLYQPANVLPGTPDYTVKWNVILAYDSVMKAREGETIIGTSHAEEWAQRTIYRSDLSTGAPVPPLQPPAVPSNLQATPVNGTRIDLSWTDNSADEDGFRVERAPDAGGVAGTFTQIASVSSNVTSYANTGLTNNTKYWYRIRSFNTVGPSAYSNLATATTPIAPAAPSNLQAKAVSSVIVDLTWTDNSANENNFRIERAPDAGGVPGTFALVTTVGANITTYRNTGLTAGTPYWYRVRSQNGAGNSAFTPNTPVTTLVFAPPSNLVANAYLVGTTRNVDLTWTPGSEITVDIFRNGTRISNGRVNDGGPFNNKPANSLGTSITYQVCAAGKTGAANCSAVVTATF